MSDFDRLTLRQVLDLGNKMRGAEGAKSFLSGELVLVEREEYARLQRIMADQSLGGFPNGGIIYTRVDLDVEAFLADWVRFYKKVFGRIVDVSTIRLPPFRLGFGWGILVIPGVTTDLAYRVSRDRFGAWKYTNAVLDEAVLTNERTTVNGPYIVWCRDTVEADPNLANLSANQIAERKLRTMTLLERELLGLWYHWKTNQHLDTATWTLCAGSRISSGTVPSMRRHNDEMYVDWYRMGSRDPSVCAREVVEVDPPAEQAA